MTRCMEFPGYTTSQVTSTNIMFTIRLACYSTGYKIVHWVHVPCIVYNMTCSKYGYYCHSWHMLTNRGKWVHVFWRCWCCAWNNSSAIFKRALFELNWNFIKALAPSRVVTFFRRRASWLSQSFCRLWLCRVGKIRTGSWEKCGDVWILFVQLLIRKQTVLLSNYVVFWRR